MKGLFIVFEGPDCSGKTTQVGILAERLKTLCVPVVTVREPGGTEAGEHIREYLKSAKPLTPNAEALLFQAARAELVERVIKPALREGKVVIADRFTASSLAYQVAVRGVDDSFVRKASEFAAQGIRPDLTILLSLPPYELRERLATRSSVKGVPSGKDRFDGFTGEQHELVQQAYFKIFTARKHWRLLDGCLGQEQLGDEVWKLVNPMLNELFEKEA